MNMGTWIELLGKSQDDPQVQAALAAAGVKKLPKRDRDGFHVVFELKGHYLWLVMTDEAYQKRLKDQDIGEGPLILTSVEAVLSHRKKKGGYDGSLALGLAAGMTRDDVRKVLGTPSTVVDDGPADIWLRDGLKVQVTYTDELILQTQSLDLPRAAA
jgi:hypothetical protein